MSVPIEKLQLRIILREKAFVTWVDPSGVSSTLGSSLPNNRQSPEFLMTASYDSEGHVHIDFSIMVFIKPGKKSQMEMMFVVPPNANFANASTTLPNPDSENSPLPDASALHNSGISDESGHAILIPFNLPTKGFVIMKKTTSATIRARNRTSHQVIRMLESLSNMTIFDVYIRPSDYARRALKALSKRLGITGAATHKPNMLEMYVEQGAMLVEWGRFVYENRQDVLSPSHTNNLTRPLPKVQVSPPQLALEEERLSPDTNEGLVGTLTRTPVTPPLAPILHGISSPSDAKLSDDEVNLEDFEEDSRCVELDFEADLDREFLANLYSRHPSQQLKDDLVVPKMLESKLVEWLTGALTTNPNAHEHKRLITKLSILAHCIRTSNAEVFDATIPLCSALLFHDPLDSDNAQLREERNRWLICDMVRLIKWTNEFHYGAELNSLLVDDFMKLGSVGRTFASRSKYDDAEYRLQKSICIARVLIGFSKSGENINKESSEPVSRKRDALETNGNISKRPRNIM
ncbi:hypothetical protein EAF04_000906 [Stromatinia cepivora]|nr:hypothetical protein EAF04_000906 [Stromatinia cepivora]